MVGLALHLHMAMQYRVKQHQGKTSNFATLIDLFIYSQFTKALGLLNELQADMRHLFLQIVCRLSNCVSRLLDIFACTSSTKILVVAIMVKHLIKSIAATTRTAVQSSGDSSIDFYLRSVNIYNTLHYSNLNLAQFETFEKRKFRICSKL